MNTIRPDKALLMYAMTRLGYSVQSLAFATGIKNDTLSRKLNGHTMFTSDEIARISCVLKLTPKDIVNIFMPGCLKNGTKEEPHENI